MGKKNIVLTGATGFLGAFLLEGLLERGYRVIVLGRPAGETKLAERLTNLVRWLDIVPGDRLLPFEVDFAKQHLGLDEKKYAELCESTGKIIHCASDTSFAEHNRTRVEAANVNSLSSLLELAGDAHAEHFYYISTAYAAGVCQGLCRETPVGTARFTNVYEETKAKAEGMISQSCAACGIPLAILRPSIVYGHSRSGKSLRFNALYYCVKSLMYIRDIFAKDIAGGGERSGKWGFRRDADGAVYLPLAVWLPERGGINLIPVDYFVATTLAVLEAENSGGIYHITCDDPPDIPILINYAERFLGIRGIRAVWGAPAKKEAANPAEELFAKFIEQYRPYLSDRRVFDRSRIKRIAPNLSTPAFTYDIFERCMTYAIACDWGKMPGFPE